MRAVEQIVRAAGRLLPHEPSMCFRPFVFNEWWSFAVQYLWPVRRKTQNPLMFLFHISLQITWHHRNLKMNSLANLALRRTGARTIGQQARYSVSSKNSLDVDHYTSGWNFEDVGDFTKAGKYQIQTFNKISEKVRSLKIVKLRWFGDCSVTRIKFILGPNLDESWGDLWKSQGDLWRNLWKNFIFNFKNVFAHDSRIIISGSRKILPKQVRGEGNWMGY